TETIPRDAGHVERLREVRVHRRWREGDRRGAGEAAGGAAVALAGRVLRGLRRGRRRPRQGRLAPGLPERPRPLRVAESRREVGEAVRRADEGTRAAPQAGPRRAQPRGPLLPELGGGSPGPKRRGPPGPLRTAF